MHNVQMGNDALRTLALIVAERARAANITQQQIAEAIGASQSQVSRILSGSSRRHSKLFAEVCIYVENAARGISPEVVRENDVLIEALASVWDGTAHQANAIATVIRSLGVLSKPGGHAVATSRAT